MEIPKEFLFFLLYFHPFISIIQLTLNYMGVYLYSKYPLNHFFDIH